MDLEKALEQFDVAEANLKRLETVWAEMADLIPSGIVFGEEQRYTELSRAYTTIRKGLPAIGGFSLSEDPWPLNDIAQNRLDAWEIDEISAKMSVEEGVEAPGRDIAEYRSRLAAARRELVRDQLTRMMTEVESLLGKMLPRVESNTTPITDELWDDFCQVIAQIERLGGSQIPRTGRWSDLHRHMSFAQGHDLHDIANMDWPSVREDIQAGLYSELEPLPMELGDLSEIVRAKPAGPVTTKLNWSAISADEFERLLFNIVADANNYVNPQWLMQTNAPDRGRDISVERVNQDSLSGTKNHRIIIQAKHWQSKSVNPHDVAEAKNLITLWEPPLVNVLIIATSGRFTTDAVAWVEKHNNDGGRPYIEMWPDSHLELILAQRPHLVAGFNLR
ncbi:restriction endonuclease [Nocardia cyriacigeorgica]|uniref:restriction endonuclease n=1 Tax=Nocardia cyriacigeorgica TaxID=135487 RepID=UPI002455DD28|nr:restriction endonuclease [Nocardia cyriacigeorgica]